MQKYGLQANAEPCAQEPLARPCLVCDDQAPRYAWTDYSGEAYCVRCGIPYQLKWGTLSEGESYPRVNVRQDAIPMFRRYFQETSRPAGQGTFIIWHDYPEIARQRAEFNDWWQLHRHEYPDLQQEPKEERQDGKRSESS